MSDLPVIQHITGHSQKSLGAGLEPLGNQWFSLREGTGVDYTREEVWDLFVESLECPATGFF